MTEREKERERERRENIIIVEITTRVLKRN
jgi:hypothetical protein